MTNLLTVAATLALAASSGLSSAFTTPATSFVPRRVASAVSQSPAHSASSTALCMAGGDQSFKKVFLAGASKGVGRHIAEKLAASGSTEVVCLVRSDEALEELSAMDGVTAIKGDAFEYKSVEGAMDGCDAAITTLGGAVDDEGQRVDYVGNNNVIEAAGILGVTRVVLVTSVGCGNSKEAAPPSVFEVLKDVLAAKEKAERILQRYYTNMNWTIVRPGGLKSEDATGTAILTEDNMAIGSIHRADVADLVVQALGSSKTERKVLSAVDPEITSAANTEGSTWEKFEL